MKHKFIKEKLFLKLELKKIKTWVQFNMKKLCLCIHEPPELENLEMSYNQSLYNDNLQNMYSLSIFSNIPLGKKLWR